MRLIDADAAIEAVEKSMLENPHENVIHRSMHDHEHRHFLTILMGLSSVYPERETGQWIPSDSELEIKCNKCGKDFSEYIYSIDYVFLAEYPKFCPNCGADMRGEENETN